MNDVRNSRDDWQALADDWRQQPGSAIDSAALLQEVRRRGRRLTRGRREDPPSWGGGPAARGRASWEARGR